MDGGIQNHQSFGDYLTGSIPEKTSLLAGIKQLGSQAGTAVLQGFSSIFSSVTVRFSFAKQSLLNRWKGQAANESNGILSKFTETGGTSSGFNLRDYLGKMNISFSRSSQEEHLTSDTTVLRDSINAPVKKTFNEPKKF